MGGDWQIYYTNATVGDVKCGFKRTFFSVGTEKHEKRLLKTNKPCNGYRIMDNFSNSINSFYNSAKNFQTTSSKILK